MLNLVFKIFKKLINFFYFYSLNVIVSIPELSFQMGLLFGRCDENQRKKDLENLMKYYKQKEQSQYLGQVSNDASNDFNNLETTYDAYELPNTNYRSSYRIKRNANHPCCEDPCSVLQLYQYCGFE